MLYSMTGHGHASGKAGSLSIDVEVRTVNNRYLKVSSRISEVASFFEPQLESVIREYVRRGSVTISIRVGEQGTENLATIQPSVIRTYVDQCRQIASDLGLEMQIRIGELLALPGVMQSARIEDSEALEGPLRNVLVDSLKDLNRMRASEGAAMNAELSQGLDQIEEIRKSIELRAPVVIDEYRKRLDAKIRSGLADFGQPSAEVDIIKEVLVYSDRCDVREELVRLASHIVQFRAALEASESQGRRLDFLIQELFRETNTIGSKANDSAVSHSVVSIKTLLEQMRELVQNVE